MQKEDPEFDTPILFLIFNRPDLTEKVFGQIRKIRPKQLFIGADGPRKDKPGEDEKCQATRQLVLDMIDWDCEVKTLFREENLGCGLAVSQAITWFFEHVEMGIILEDDCYPDLSFFRFCSEILKYHKNNSKVMHIGGTNWQLDKKRGYGSYYFSNFAHVWGWASWRDRWLKYDHNIQYKINLATKFTNKTELAFWQNSLKALLENKVDSWAYRWKYSIWYNEGVCIIPEKNLVKNLGFGSNSTHTSSKTNHYDSIKLEKCSTKIIHVDEFQISKKADIFTIKKHYMPQRKIATLMLFFTKTRLFSNLYAKVISFRKTKEKKRLRKINRYNSGSTNLIRPEIQYVDSVSLLAGYKEIFEDNCYYFACDLKEPIIIDCGANIGLATIYFKQKHPSAQIICFEPDPDIFKVLKHNIENLHLKNIELHNKAVWIDDKVIHFRKEGGFGGRLPLNIDINQVDIIKVNAIKLSNYLDRNINLLKIDIEGAEVDVLKSIEKKLSNVLNIFIEYHSPTNEHQKLDEILIILKRNNFRYYIKEAFVAKNPFAHIDVQDGMDLQLNIYAINQSI